MLNIGRRLIHYADHAVLSMNSIKQGIRPNGKPLGLWLSAEGEDDWLAYCKGNYRHGLAEALVATEVVLYPDANVLHISNVGEFESFEKEYYLPDNLDNPWVPFDGITWIQVAEKYDGIVISPYRFEHRRLSEWYYAWDCASGCIWERNAVREFRVLTQTTGEGNVAARDA